MENVTCNPLLLHSAGHVIDFQKKKKKVTVQSLLGKSGEKLLLTAVKSWTMRLWLLLGAWIVEEQLILKIQVPPLLCTGQSHFLKPCV